MTLELKDRLAEIRARLEAATPGPWVPAGLPYNWINDPYVETEAGVYICQTVYDMQEGSQDHNIAADTEFIAHAPEDIAYLLGEIDDRDEKLHQIRQWANAYPETAFKEPDLDKTREVLESAGISMAGLHGTWGRHILEGIREILGDKR